MAEATADERAWQRQLAQQQRSAAEIPSDSVNANQVLNEGEQRDAARSNAQLLRRQRAEAAGRSLQAGGRAAQVGGMALRGAGKGLQAAGRAGVRAGAALSETGVGALAGIPLGAIGGATAAAGAGVAGTGRSMQASGRAAATAGRRLRRAAAGKSPLGGEEDLVRTVQRARNIYRLINGASALSIVGLIITFIVMNFQLIAGNLLHSESVPALNKLEIFLLVLLDLLMFFVLLLVLMFVSFLTSPDLYVEVFLAGLDATTLGHVIRVLVPDAFLGSVLTKFPDLIL